MYAYKRMFPMKYVYSARMFLSFCVLASISLSGKVLIIMGASCSGKSTLSAKLLDFLGDQWKLVELDAIEDAFKTLGKDTADSSLLNAVVDQSNQYVAAGWNVIIDTNIYHEVLRTISTDDKTFVLVHCPLNILLERNAQRDVVLQRNPFRAARAREYVEKTFYNFEHFYEYDLLVDASTNETEYNQGCCLNFMQSKSQ